MEPTNAVPPSVRLKELLAVHDRDRTEEQWDELIELEIMLAPENRVKQAGRNEGPNQQGPGAKRNNNRKSGKKRPNNRPRRQPEQASTNK